MKKLFLFYFLSTGFYINAQEQVTFYFDFNDASLKTPLKQKLLDKLVENKIEISKIEGYCDWKGTNEYNVDLSLRRVTAVREFLDRNNVKFAKNYESKGFGEDFKQAQEQSENRKVVVYYTKLSDVVIKPKKEDNKLTSAVKLAKKGDLIVLKNMLFFNMLPDLKPSSKPILSELLAIMEQNPSLKIEIQGHICCEQRNDGIELSVARAKTVYDYLVINKINQNRLTYKGFGNSRPLHPIPEQSELQQNENRRVEILIVAN